MKDILDEVDVKLIEKELTEDKFLRMSSKGNNLIFSLNAHDSPNVMKQIGRLREISFRLAGGGTGKAADIDDYDIAEIPFKQLVVWDPKDKIIVGGYRYLEGNQMAKDENGMPKTPTSKLFDVREKFVEKYLNNTIELGRSFIQPSYQSTNDARKSIFALDNLWDGLGILINNNPEMKYFFGKVTMYPSFNEEAKSLIRLFFKQKMSDPENLIIPKKALECPKEFEVKYADLFNADNLDDNMKILNKKVRDLNVNIPPLVSAYMKLSPSMKTFGTSINEAFGGVEETAIFISIDDIYENKKERYVSNIDRTMRK